MRRHKNACPWCGKGNARLKVARDEHGSSGSILMSRIHIACIDCGAQSPTRFGVDLIHADAQTKRAWEQWRALTAVTFPETVKETA